MDGQPIKRRTWWESWGRVVRFRLLVPVWRSRRAPEYSARGSMVGLAWAFTPLVGAQIFLCALTWLVARRLFKWNFSLVVACAWTWATNFATMVPAYYTFYVTGYYMLGLSRTNRLDFALCVQPLKEAIAAEPGVLNAAILSIAFLFKDVGLVMAVGCIPYMVLSGWLGYRFTLWYLKKKRYGVSRNH